MKRNLAIFDFDGTITNKDSFLEFMKFYKGQFRFYKGFIYLSPILVLYILKVIPNWRAKEAVLSFFFKGENVKQFSENCELFSKKIIPSLIRSEAFKEIEKHKKNGSRIVVISASAEDWIRPWCLKHNLELIGTQLEVLNGRLSGKILGKNCYGQEKVSRLKAFLKTEDYDKIYAYGDSNGDKYILDLAHYPYFKLFK